MKKDKHYTLGCRMELMSPREWLTHIFHKIVNANCICHEISGEKT